MKYQLISSGRLLVGSEEKESVARIQRISKLPEEQVRKSLLNGKPRKLLSSNDKEKVKKAALAFRKAGLEVKVKVWQAPSEAETDGPGSIAPHKEKGKPEKERIDSLPPSIARKKSASAKKKSRFGRCLVSFLLLLIILTSSAIGYAWYWLHRPLPDKVAAAEQALFDGNLVIAGLVDVKKLTLLERYWFGELDPKALPLDTHQQGLLNNLLSGAPKFRENLTHILYSASIAPDQQQGTQLMLLAGKFEKTSLLKTLGTFFQVEQIDKNRWQINPLTPSDKDSSCAENTPKTGQKGFSLQISPDWLMLFTDSASADHTWERLSTGQEAKQDLRVWYNYRKGKFMSFMVVTPAEAGKAIGGMPGLMAQGAISKTPQVKGIALGLEAHPLKGGLNTNIHLSSTDTRWNTSAADGIQKKITALQQDTRSTTPTLADVLSRIKPSGKTAGLDIDVRMDPQLLRDLGQVLREGLSSAFAGISGKNTNGGGSAEQINDNPAEYKDIPLTNLPDYIQNSSQSEPPLFLDGPFAVDLKSVVPDDNGVLKIQIEGKAQLPEKSDGLFNTIGVLSLHVNSVQNASGQELLRDEHCMSPNDLSGQSPNHEPETNNMHQQDQGWVWKYVRLQPNVSVEQIQKITGEISFSTPTQVRKFPIPLQAGEAIEHGGLRFHLSSVKKDSVSYQVSGNAEHLVEIRGLNKAGQVLQQGWLMNDKNTGRATQSFAGQIETLEIFVAENILEQKTDFALTDLFQAGKEAKEDKTPDWYGPKKISLTDWNAYKKLKLKNLQVDPKKDWHMMGNKNTLPIAEGNWPPIRLFISHIPKGWGNNPTAHLYFPQLQDLPGVLSGLSYRIDEPAPEGDAEERYHPVSYWYNSKSGKVLVKHSLKDKPIALNSFSLLTGLADNQKLDRLKGELTFRLPQKTRTEKMALSELWGSQTKEGITVTLSEVARGMFPGYSLKIEGAIDKLVNLHGIGTDGQQVLASPINFQDGGYWTMTLPFGRGIENVELVIATEQEILKYPFDFKAKYPAE